MTIYYFGPTKGEEPKPVDYKYPAIPQAVECECCKEEKLRNTK